MSKNCTIDQIEGASGLIGSYDADMFHEEHVSRISPSETRTQRIEKVFGGAGMCQSHAIFERNESPEVDTTSSSHEPRNLHFSETREAQLPFWPPQLSNTRHQLQKEAIAQNQRRGAGMANDDYDGLYKRHFDLQGQRGGIIDIRFNIVGQRSILQESISTFQQAQAELMAQVKAFPAADAGSQHADLLSSAISSIQRSEDNLMQKLEQTKSLEQQLNTLEYELGREENEFFGSLRAILPSLIKPEQSSDTLLPLADNLTSRGKPNDSREDALHTFYDKSSDVPILEEQLAELDQTFDYERAQRETRANLGQPISPPDLEFYTQYHQDREVLQKELVQTRSAVTRLQARCVQLGLIPPPPAPPSLNEDMANLPEQRPPKNRSWMHSSESGERLEQSFFSEGHEVRKSSAPTLPTMTNPRDRINQWLSEAQVTADSPEAHTSASTTDSQLPALRGSSPTCKENIPADPASLRSASPESWQDIDEPQWRLERAISRTSNISKLSRSDQQPPQKSPKQSWNDATNFL